METAKTPLVSGRANAWMRRGLLLGFLLLLFPMTSFTEANQQSSLSAIVNASGAPTEMKFSELKAVMKGETQRWKSGKRIVIALMKTNTPIGKSTSSKIYDMSGEELNKYWLSLVFQGKAQAPVFFTSVTELQSFVASNPGAIGIVDKPFSNAEVKQVIVDGKPIF